MGTNENFLSKIGLGSLDTGMLIFILAIVLFIVTVMAIVLTIELCKLKKRYIRFCGGRDAKSLEKEIGNIFVENASLREMTERNRKDIRVLFRKMETTFQKVGLVKYDAFAQMGGKLSFSLCMLDEKNNGFVINSIHGGDGCYTYTKHIVNGQCELTLGNEEQQALNEALQK